MHPSVLGFFEPNTTFILTEANGEVDGRHIIGIFEGQFFVPEGISRNQRFYSRELWDSCLASKEVQSMLAERRMFGTISHEQPIDDKALMEGKVSHIVTHLEIREGNLGWGRAVILNTPVGQFLKTYLGAKAKLYTSSRAYGKYQGEHKGVPKVDEATYILKGFDIVLDPGFLEANPQLKECYESLKVTQLNTNPTKGEYRMDKELFESVVKERTRLEGEIATVQSQLAESARSTEKYKNENVVICEENNSLKEKVKDLERQMKLLKEYKAFGTPREVEEALKSFEALVDKVGTPAKIREALKKAEKIANENLAYKKEFGTLAEMRSAFEASERVISAYHKLGTIAEIEKFTEVAEKREAEVAKSKRAERVKTLAESLGVTPDKVTAVIDHLKTDEAIKNFFKGLTESVKNKEEWTKKKPTNENKAGDKGRKLFEGSRASRIMNKFT